METKTELVESLLERTAEYAKTSVELLKLKALDKTSAVVSSMVPRWIAITFVAIFMLFATLGLAVWIGELLGKLYYGFFAVAAFYGLLAIIICFLHKWLKKRINNYIIKKVFT